MKLLNGGNIKEIHYGSTEDIQRKKGIIYDYLIFNI